MNYAILRHLLTMNYTSFTTTFNLPNLIGYYYLTIFTSRYINSYYFYHLQPTTDTLIYVRHTALYKSIGIGIGPLQVFFCYFSFFVYYM